MKGDPSPFIFYFNFTLSKQNKKEKQMYKK